VPQAIIKSVSIHIETSNKHSSQTGYLHIQLEPPANLQCAVNQVVVTQKSSFWEACCSLRSKTKWTVCVEENGQIEILSVLQQDTFILRFYDLES
jgi:hypothetical protein